MTLRLAQWPGRPGVASPAILLWPAQIIDAVPDADGWEWTITDGHEPLDLSGGDGYRLVMDWHERNERVPTGRLLEALRRGHGIQLIWGTLQAYRSGLADEVLTISAFDSTWYDIDGPADVIAGLEETFAWARYPV